MARISGLRERRDKIWYDTHVIEPGQTAQFFRGTNIGNWFLTNQVMPGLFASVKDSSYLVLALGARCIGKTREEEDLLLDHILLRLNVGDRPLHDILGPQASMLRHVFSQKELEAMEVFADEPPTKEMLWERVNGTPPPVFRVGYHLIRPICVPVLQNAGVLVKAANTLPEAVRLRVHVFGLETRDVI